MESTNLASGDYNDNTIHPSKSVENLKVENIMEPSRIQDEQPKIEDEEIIKVDDVTPQTIDEKETKLKERIAQCRNLIESLKFELNEEKAKYEKDCKKSHSSTVQEIVPPECAANCHSTTFLNCEECCPDSSGIYTECVDNKLIIDENLMEYEKQLQKYQTTLNMAQIEKKNAIRKQMLTKAFQLKLLEVENQCNIELLRVKQSLQCLEPLRMIVSKWKNSNEGSLYDCNNFQLIPRYPEIRATSRSDINSFKEDVDIKITNENITSNDSVSDC